MTTSSKQELFDFQKKILNSIAREDSSAIFSCPSSGKTFMSYNLSKKKHSDKPTLVVTQNAVNDKLEFVKEWRKHDKNCKILVVFSSKTTKKSAKMASEEFDFDYLLGTVAHKNDTIVLEDYDLITVSYNFFGEMKPKKWPKDMYLIFDECHFLKNKNAYFTQAAKFRSYPKLLLTATPIGNFNHEYYNYFYLMDKVDTTYSKGKKEFESKYVIKQEMFNGVITYQVPVMNNNEAELFGRLSEFSYFLSRKEMLDALSEQGIYLPEIDFKRVDLIDSKVNAKMIKAVKNNYFEQDDGEIVFYENSSQKYHHLCQMSSSGNNKINWIKENLEKYSNPIIFYHYKQDLAVLENEIKGHYTLSTLDEWKEKGGVLLLHMVNNVGLNLQNSDSIIYYSPPKGALQYKQSSLRTSRPGSLFNDNYIVKLIGSALEHNIWNSIDANREAAQIMRDFEEGRLI